MQNSAFVDPHHTEEDEELFSQRSSVGSLPQAPIRAVDGSGITVAPEFPQRDVTNAGFDAGAQPFPEAEELRKDHAADEPALALNGNAPNLLPNLNNGQEYSFLNQGLLNPVYK